MQLIDMILKGGPLALIAASFGFLWYVINQMEKRFSVEIQRIENEMESRIETRITRLEEKIDRLTERLSELLGRRVA